MRIIHTADWHLGRIFHGIHLTEDQSFVLDDFIRFVRDSRADVVLVSGDIYDRAVPPPDAVRLLDDVLCRLCFDCHVPVVMIAGNHDSPDRLSFGSRVFANQNIHVMGLPVFPLKPVVFQDQHGTVSVFTLPYAEPPVVRQITGEEDVKDHESAMKALLGGVVLPQRSVLMAHAFAAGCTQSDSERPLSVGGASVVGTDCFKGFSYVALGHLHCSQEVTGSTACYSGSLMKYSFAEVSHVKSINMVEIDEKGGAVVERIPLLSRHDLRCVDGMLDELLKHAKTEDYIMVRLLDREPVLDAMGRLRTVFPNILHIERPGLRLASGELSGCRPERMSDQELFSAFFHQVTGTQLTEPEIRVFAEVVDVLRKEQREAEL